MNKANELLRRALDVMSYWSESKATDLKVEIRTYLANQETAKDEPVVFIRPDHLAKARKSPFLCQVGPVQVADFVPLYLHPQEPKKPMTEEEIDLACNQEESVEYICGFYSGIRFAEKHHGIGGEDET